MVIGGMQKLTLLDYPEKTAAIVFTKGCNFRCPFCHNSGLLEYSSDDNMDEEEVLEYLERRKNVLDGVVVSGGEPTIQEDLEEFLKKLKNLGYLVKLDTNGTNPEKVKDLIEKGLIDYVAMDIKIDFDNYAKVACVKRIDIDSIKKSIELLENSNIGYEFRTTVAVQLHNFKSLHEIASYLKPSSKYFIQNYKECETVLAPGLTSFKESELETIVKILNEDYPNVSLR